jgi:hypothetical protein
VVRLAFCLGNFAASNEACRIDIAENTVTAEFLPELLAKYVEASKDTTDRDASVKSRGELIHGRLTVEIKARFN